MKGKLGVYLSKIKNESGEYEILQLLEKSLDTNNPEKGEVPIKLLGFGEISLVFEIISDKTKDLAFKRLPIFETEEQVEKHIAGFKKYSELLNNELNIKTPAEDAVWVFADEKKKKISLYCIQKKLNPNAIGNKVIHDLKIEEIKKLILLILRKMKNIWKFNQENLEKGIQIGLDGQISNWVVEGYDKENPIIKDNNEFLYIDTSTPMYRINGEDALDRTIFLKIVPSFMQWIFKLFFLDEVLDRYYDWREVIIDLIANFHKEQLSEMIPDLLNVVNDFFASEAKEFDIKPITLEEIDKYYKSDKKIWVLLQNIRHFDRFLKTKIFRKNYDFYLPEKIKR
ncbi:MAG: DUF6206 family protein [Promethearchaeota archaeon]